MTDGPEAPASADDGAEATRAKALPMVSGGEGSLVPARMINEVLYCERLMYLEWVQGEWADNFFTVEGRFVHRRADKSGKGLEAAKQSEKKEEAARESRPYQARAVWLSSERLGLTAKIDVVDVDGDLVTPIEYKRGKRPDVAEGAWLPERAQLAAQVMLLRDHGHRVEEAAIYYAGDKQRVPIAITDELVQTVERAVKRARELALEGTMPPPLVDSPKCKGCSLAGICLPDEVNLLSREGEGTSQEAASGPPAPGSVRRLYPARDDKVPLYVQDHAAYVRVRGERLVIESKGEALSEARIANTSQLCIFGSVQVSSQALRELLTRGIPVSYFTTGGWLVGRATGFESKNVELRLAQYRAAEDPAFRLKIATGMVASKILNSRTMLRRNHAAPASVALFELKQLARKAREAPSAESLLGIEGTAARVYFREFSGMLKSGDDQGPSFDFEGRNRRPPRDPVNALLSLAYSLLSKEFVNALAGVGFDPMLGFYHRPRFGRPALALDLMEEFRPLVADSVVINAINNEVIQKDDFVTSGGATNLKPAARRRFISAFERRMSQLVTHGVFDYRVSYRRILELQARLLSRLLLGELTEYPAFRTR